MNGGAYRLASSQRDARTRFSKQSQDRLRVLRIATFENIGDHSRIHMRQGRDDLGRGLVDIDLRSAIENRYEGKSGIDERRRQSPHEPQFGGALKRRLPWPIIQARILVGVGFRVFAARRRLCPPGDNMIRKRIRIAGLCSERGKQAGEQVA